MKRIAIFLIALTLAACGGGNDASEPQASVDCTGRPPILAVNAALAADCVYPVDVAGLSVDAAVESVHAVVDQARGDTGAVRVYLVGSGIGAEAGLNFMGTHRGKVEVASLWLTTYDPATSRIGGLDDTIASIYLNAGDDSAACQTIANRILSESTFTPAYCKTWPGITAFGVEQQTEAFTQMHLQ